MSSVNLSFESAENISTSGDLSIEYVVQLIDIKEQVGIDIYRDENKANWIYATTVDWHEGDQETRNVHLTYNMPPYIFADLPYGYNDLYFWCHNENITDTPLKRFRFIKTKSDGSIPDPEPDPNPKPEPDPSINILKMGTWRTIEEDSHESNSAAEYYSKGTRYFHRRIQLRDSNAYSGDTVAELVEYVYNGEKLYIPLFAALRCTNEQANDMVEGSFFDLNDNEVYVGRYMPKEFWLNLPENILSAVINGINSNADSYSKIKDGDLLGIDEFSDAKEKIHKAVAYDGKQKRFVESNTALSNRDECCICIPVMGPYKKYEVVRMGLLKNSENNTTYDQKKVISDNTLIYGMTCNSMTFVDTDDPNKQWKWIKHVYNNEIYYICTSAAAALFGNQDLVNIKGKQIMLNNRKLQYCILSPYDGEKSAMLYSPSFLESDMVYFLKPPGESIRLWGTTYSGGTDFYYFRSIDDFGIFFSSYTSGWAGYGERTGNYYPIFKLINQAPTISEQDKQLEDKVKPFTVYYFVDDSDENDKLTITEKLNGTTYRTITNAVRKNQYSFEINSNMFSNLRLYDMNTIEIIVSDGIFSTTRTYTFRKTNTAPTINYSGSLNLGRITTKPTIDYSVHDAEGDEITVTERLNGKTIRTFTAASDTSCTVQISDDAWLSCGSDTSTVEITVRDDAGGSSNKTITFNRSIDRIEAITKPIETTSAVTKISLDIDWDTTNASGKVFVCNNGFDDIPTWEDMTTSVGLSNAYTLTNNTKVADKWGVSVKVTIKKDEGATNEVSLYSIKGTYQ